MMRETGSRHVADRPVDERSFLEARTLTMSFPWEDGFRTVLDDLSFGVRRGEFICILGRSGCGKTTLLKILAGFLKPTAGSILLEGRPVSRPGPDRCVVFQEDALFPWLTVEENMGFGLCNAGVGKRDTRRRVDRMLEMVDLTDYRGYLPREISGGMKQRVALGRVLVLNPKVLLMDEPFAALDAQTREEMQNLLLSLWGRFSHTVLFVTHDVTEAVVMADRILVMQKNPGKIREEIDVVLSRPRMRDRGEFMLFFRRLRETLRD